MLPLVVALNVAGTVAVEDRTEVRGRVVRSPRVDDFGQPRVGADGQFLKNDSKTAVVSDLETDPVGRLRLARTDDALTLAYAPRIVLANFGNAGAAQGGETTVDLIHRPMLTLEAQLDPRTRMAVNSLVQFGSTTPGTLLLPERWNGEDRPPIPRAFPVLPFAKQTFLAIYAAAGVARQLSPRWSATLSAFYITFGQPTQAGRIAAGGTTYLQNPGVNLEFEYRHRATDTFLFNMAPQVNIVQATPIETTNEGIPLGADNLPLYDVNGIREVNGTPVEAKRVNRQAPNTYQLLLEARYRKQLYRLTTYELAAGANILQQTIPRAIVPTFANNPDGTPVLNPDGTPQTEVRDNPFGLLGRTPGTVAPSNTRFNVLPVGEVLINQGFAASNAQGRLIAFSRADAWLNTVSGEISARSATVAAVNLDFGLDALRAQIAFVQSLPLSESTTAFRQVITELAYQRELTRSWFFDVGARLGYQDAEVFKNRVDPALSFSSQFLQPGAFAGIAWRPLPAKL